MHKGFYISFFEGFWSEEAQQLGNAHCDVCGFSVSQCAKRRYGQFVMQ
jgi:hypothetical protein